MGAGEAHGLLGVFEVGVVCGVMTLLGDAVFHEKASDAD